MAGGNHKHQEIVDPDVTVILRWMDSAGSDGGCELTVDQRKLRTGEETPAPRSVDNGGLDDRCRRGGLARALTPATTPGCLGRRQIGGLRIDCSGWKAVEVGGWRGGLDRRGTVRRLCRSEKQERQLFSCVAILTVTISPCVCSHTHLSLWVYSLLQRDIYENFQKHSYF